ncbi:hypothetical protein A3C89_00435 [Candidatus Kaiserbacteria bacterium RIFCSPHIGHO2_02_FULL_50_50]|uniref:Uncharacterized protein n=1 Tax=Candidatus Kaiserbacteria bacterium RIFCSPHIGHO2_02_FULL_50_50 TaxID=1798492 RepID=A0A1F6DEC8_9BACT|nr:MAG: hypothetical protein A3C89_00435 [Candidatus Kaiserbacteria bacterium RIFCSPHIGHO2_02_FULL_50_50]OGG89209.1 MAG: hypothetical protein A3G62_01115 [Candidatus Kaiserbacteria bacterium RIFCSPLOWO2_12_FULL_50_10]
MFRIIGIIALLALPATLSAAVGISPSGIEATVPSGAQQDGSVIFMRDDEDAKTAMYVTVFSDSAFLLTEGVEYFMDAGVKRITIPYRFDATEYVPGSYTGILYLRPERASSRAVNGVQVQVQGGVRAAMTVTAPVAATWKDGARENIRDHFALYQETAGYLMGRAKAYVAGIF